MLLLLKLLGAYCSYIELFVVDLTGELIDIPNPTGTSKESCQGKRFGHFK